MHIIFSGSRKLNTAWPSAHFAAIFAWAVSTVALRVLITPSGSDAPKIAVPATMTLLPEVKPVQSRMPTDERNYLPASAQTSIVLGPTPPSTSMSLSGKRALSSATFETHLSKNFCPPRPAIFRELHFARRFLCEEAYQGILSSQVACRRRQRSHLWWRRRECQERSRHQPSSFFRELHEWVEADRLRRYFSGCWFIAEGSQAYKSLQCGSSTGHRRHPQCHSPT